MVEVSDNNTSGSCWDQLSPHIIYSKVVDFFFQFFIMSYDFFWTEIENVRICNSFHSAGIIHLTDGDIVVQTTIKNM